MQEDFYKLKLDELYTNISSSEEGLTELEARKRLERNGLNILKEEKKQSNYIKFLKQFKNLMVIILIFAAGFSAIAAYLENESFFESIIILAIVILNAIFGYVQEAKADKAINALKKKDITDVKVKRDNKVKLINIENIVLGDILVLEAGDYIPADARVIYSASFKVEEASLTGESGSVSKENKIIKKDTIINDQTNMIFAGSNAVYGKCEAIVVKTGMDTELGIIAKALTTEAHVDTPLQKKIHNISKVLTIVIAIIIAVMVVIGIINGDDILHLIIIAISLAVAAIPEGLPAVITVILSLGMTRLANKKAVVRDISSVETLGSTEIICSDKTGTITKNEMTVVKVSYDSEILSKSNNKLLNMIMYLCNDVKKEDNKYLGDPTEIALYKYIENLKIDYSNKRIYEFPFDSDRKMMSVICEDKKEALVLTKGSMNFLLEKCTHININNKVIKLTKKHIDQIKQLEKELTKDALRVLAFAYKKIDIKDKYNIKDVEKGLIYTGLVGMIDPPRDSVKESIIKCYKAGITPIMITGDSINTAIAIAKEVGIYQEDDIAIEGIDLDKLSDKELEENVHKYKVYARVSPSHKLRIVKAWQKNGKVVAMTGDGVNDAPAIKKADVGIGMGITGTEVSKNVSDIVLIDDSFSTIVVAVEEGRNVFENIRKAILYLLTANIAEILIVFIGVLFGAEILLPIHLLYINLVTDSLPAIALSFEPGDKNIMSRKVRKNSGTIFTPFIISRIIFSSVLKAVIILFVYFITYRFIDPVNATTVAFLSLIFLELTFALTSRNLYSTVVGKGFLKNKVMNYSLIGLLILQIILITTPLSTLFEVKSLSITEYSFIIFYALFYFIVNEITKKTLSESFSDE